LVGIAQAFFARGIRNFIGAGWEVDDACALECARWFYAQALGLNTPDGGGGVSGRSPPATIGHSLLQARRKTLELKPALSSWGAYQHYGTINDKLLPFRNVPEQQQSDGAVTAQTPAGTDSPSSFSVGDSPMSPSQPTAPPAAPAADLIYVNGIDETGNYAFAPRSIGDIAKEVFVHPGVEGFNEVHVDTPRSFGVPFGMDPQKLEEAGWGIVFPEDTSQEIRTALNPLIELRRSQAGDRLKILDYKKGEQTRGWYQRYRVSAGNIDPEVVPYYLLLIGGPESIPFDFQYLLGVEYAVGRLAFATAAEYERYARSIVDYEKSKTVPNARKIAYWGTRHLGDAATNLSASLLIDPLANGAPGAAGALKRPIHVDTGFARTATVADDATKAALLDLLHDADPPAMLFTASHGMALRSGHARQFTDQGALLCQDWPGFGTLGPQHYLAGADVPDDAKVHGMVAFLFACFGAGTPDADQFLMDLSKAG